jgi:hypothetical protein
MFEYSRIQIEIELLDDHAPPGYWGTKLRGGFGTALKDVLCDHPAIKMCSDCTHFHDCNYPLLFKPQHSAMSVKLVGQPLGKQENLPPPFVLNPPFISKKTHKRGDRYTFELVLFGEAKNQVGVLIKALTEFGRKGIEHGKARSQFKIASLRDQLKEGKTIVRSSPDTDKNFDKEMETTEIVSESIMKTAEDRLPQEIPSTLTLHFVTPVRVERKNPRRYDPQSGLAIFSDCYDFVFDLSERVAELWQLYGDDWQGQTNFFRWREQLLKASRQIVWLEDSLRIERRKRESTTQSRELPIDGFVGEVKLQGNFSSLWTLFRIGEIVHLGQMTSFGFGRYLLL